MHKRMYGGVAYGSLSLEVKGENLGNTNLNRAVKKDGMVEFNKLPIGRKHPQCFCLLAYSNLSKGDKTNTLGCSRKIHEKSTANFP